MAAQLQIIHHRPPTLIELLSVVAPAAIDVRQEDFPRGRDLPRFLDALKPAHSVALRSHLLRAQAEPL
jgi:hypothetical protein